MLNPSSFSLIYFSRLFFFLSPPGQKFYLLSSLTIVSQWHIFKSKFETNSLAMKNEKELYPKGISPEKRVYIGATHQFTKWKTAGVRSPHAPQLSRVKRHSRLMLNPSSFSLIYFLSRLFFFSLPSRTKVLLTFLPNNNPRYTSTRNSIRKNK